MNSLALVSRKVGVHGWGLAASPSYVKARGVPRSPAELSGEQPAYLLTTVGRRDLPRVRAVADAVEAAVRALR